MLYMCAPWPCNTQKHKDRLCCASAAHKHFYQLSLQLYLLKTCHSQIRATLYKHAVLVSICLCKTHVVMNHNCDGHLRPWSCSAAF